MLKALRFVPVLKAVTTFRSCNGRSANAGHSHYSSPTSIRRNLPKLQEIAVTVATTLNFISVY